MVSLFLLPRKSKAQLNFFNKQLFFFHLLLQIQSAFFCEAIQIFSCRELYKNKAAETGAQELEQQAYVCSETLPVPSAATLDTRKSPNILETWRSNSSHFPLSSKRVFYSKLPGYCTIKILTAASFLNRNLNCSASLIILSAPSFLSSAFLKDIRFNMIALMYSTTTLRWASIVIVWKKIKWWRIMPVIPANVAIIFSLWTIIRLWNVYLHLITSTQFPPILHIEWL